MTTLSFTDPATGQEWTARLVTIWGRYGRELCVQHTDAEPMVEFYDAEYKDKPFFVEENGGNHWGQFVSRYYLHSFFDLEPGCGLSLNYGIPKWTISAAAVEEVSNWIKEIS